MRLDLDAKYVRDQITALLLANPELADDDVLREDMIEGNTMTFEFLSKIIRLIGENVALSEGTELYIKELRARCDRFERRQDALRSLIYQIMTGADLSKVQLPEATLSIRRGTTKVIITDEAIIPDRMCKFIRKPDLLKIREAIEHEGDCAGATLSNGGETLTIRVK